MIDVWSTTYWQGVATPFVLVAAAFLLVGIWDWVTSIRAEVLAFKPHAKNKPLTIRRRYFGIRVPWRRTHALVVLFPDWTTALPWWPAWWPTFKPFRRKPKDTE